MSLLFKKENKINFLWKVFHNNMSILLLCKAPGKQKRLSERWRKQSKFSDRQFIRVTVISCYLSTAGYWLVVIVVFMSPPFEEWWKGHIVIPFSVRPSVSVRVPDGVSNLRLSFQEFSNLRLSYQVGASVSFGHISSLFMICLNFVLPEYFSRECLWLLTGSWLAAYLYRAGSNHSSVKNINK